MATEVAGADAFTVRQEPAAGLVLCDGSDRPLLRLEVRYECALDGHRTFLAIEKAEVHVFVEPNGRNPLFRYEYVRNIGDRLPCAHIQFHGTHPELEAAMADAGDSTPRSKKRKSGKRRVVLSDLHFPVGGPRFRPPLEDVLAMLIEEFGVKPNGQSVRHALEFLASEREDWRRTQVAVVVRDAPSRAVETLVDLGYVVKWPWWRKVLRRQPAPADNIKKLQRL
ncbi:hypothetical protein G3I13_16320 [Streptomyces sp. SID6673]|nr:hypothetical protein [Streptomyces sp. SID11726]NEB25902.1 hypothetical protein [Streptomyces sp. SID6673]